MQELLSESTRNQTISFLKTLALNSGQSRTLLLVGKKGWGKFSTGLTFAQEILKISPFDSSDFFCFRNDLFALKTEFFLKKMAGSPQSWIWLQLMQRRINISRILEETLTLHAGTTLSSIKEELDEAVATQIFPQNEQSIRRFLDLAVAFDKKSGIPVNVIREALKFHSVRSLNGRISIIGNFDTADETTQNAALKLLEEPHQNHWIILTAEDEKNIIPTILSRTFKISLKKPLPKDFQYLMESNKILTSSIDIMQERLFTISNIKADLIKEFFTECTNNIEFGIKFLEFSEKLSKNNQVSLFLEELILCFEDALICRQNHIRNDLNIPIRHNQYKDFSRLFTEASTAEIEELVLFIEETKQKTSRSVIKSDAVLPSLFLEIARTLRKIKKVR